MTNRTHRFEVGDLVTVTNEGQGRRFSKTLMHATSVVTHVYDDDEVRVAQTGPAPDAPRDFGHHSNLRLLRSHRDLGGTAPGKNDPDFERTALAISQSHEGPLRLTSAARMQRAWHRRRAACATR